MNFRSPCRPVSAHFRSTTWPHRHRVNMPRRDAPISRQQQAFEMLLDQQHASHPLPVSANSKGERQSKKSKRTVSDKRGSDKVPGFVLRESLPGQQPAPQSSARIAQLYSMFGSSLERSTIEHVLDQCKHSVEATIDELLALSEHKVSEATASSSSAQPAQPSGPPASSSFWSWIPEECKGLVLRHLDSKDLAKAARTSKEFAEHIRAVRAGLGVLNVPPGLSTAAVRGMVAAYTGATTVNLARCAAQLRHTVDFANMFAAVSRGAAARLQGQPLLKLDLKGCIALRADDIASLCDYFDTLRGLSLRGCEDIDDAAALILSKYTAATDQTLLQRFSSLDVAPSSTGDNPQAAAGNPSNAALPGMPSYRNTSSQRTLLSNSVLGVRQAAAPSDPHQQTVLDLDSDTERTQGRQLAEGELQQQQQQQQQHRQPSKQQSSLQTGQQEGLELLCLAGCTKVTAKGLAALLRGSPASRSLTSLDVSRCPALTQNALDLPPKTVLQQLTANGCHGVSTVSIQLPPPAPLRTLSLTGCRKLKEVVISAPQLESLAVDSCPQLHTLQLQCPSLVSLTASQCNALTGFVPAMDCPHLQELNLFGCKQLQTEDMGESLDLLPQLAKLNMNGCVSLTRLVLTCCTKLEWLDCSGCALMHHIHAFSPALSHVRAVACHWLVAAEDALTYGSTEISQSQDCQSQDCQCENLGTLQLLLQQHMHACTTEDLSLTSAKLTNLDLTNCGQLYSLSFPELDQALGQQLISSVAAVPNKTQSKDCLARRVNVSGCHRLPDAAMTELA